MSMASLRSTACRRRPARSGVRSASRPASSAVRAEDRARPLIHSVGAFMTRSALQLVRCSWPDASWYGTLRRSVRRLYPDPGGLAPLRIERHDGQGPTVMTLPGTGKPGHGGADEGCLHDVVAAAGRYRAVPLAHPHLHRGDHHALGAEPFDVTFQLAPGVLPRLADQFGPAGDLGVARAPARLAGGLAVIVPRPDRDAEHEPRRHPARHNQLGEILPRHLTGEGRRWPVRGTRRADRGADGRELRPAEGERPPGQPDAYHPLPAKLRALSDHAADGRVPRLVHGLHERAER